LKISPLEIGERGSEQLALLGTQQSDAQRQRSKKLMSVMDELNQKMGRGTVRFGSPVPAPPGTCAARIGRRGIRRDGMSPLRFV
tara:strand:+ start:56 stop:307 length:252 start_codon:yes stop_codon:yes gene_type:complete